MRPFRPHAVEQKDGNCQTAGLPCKSHPGKREKQATAFATYPQRPNILSDFLIQAPWITKISAGLLTQWNEEPLEHLSGVFFGGGQGSLGEKRHMHEFQIFPPREESRGVSTFPFSENSSEVMRSPGKPFWSLAVAKLQPFATLCRPFSRHRTSRIPRKGAAVEVDESSRNGFCVLPGVLPKFMAGGFKPLDPSSPPLPLPLPPSPWSSPAPPKQPPGRQNYPEQSVTMHDRIKEVNGTGGSPEELMSMIKEAQRAFGSKPFKGIDPILVGR